MEGGGDGNQNSDAWVKFLHILSLRRERSFPEGLIFPAGERKGSEGEGGGKRGGREGGSEGRRIVIFSPC